MSEVSKKRKKKFYGGGYAKKSKYSQTLCPGIKGFLCTHNGHPKFCIREVYNILDEFSEIKDSEEKSPEKEEENDFENELKRDIEQVKNDSEEKEFQVVDTGVTGCVFIKSRNANPTEIVGTIIQRITETGKSQSRKILRMLPIEVTCKAYLEDIKKALNPLLDFHFKEGIKTYAIVINRRNNSNILREELIHSIGMLIKDRNPQHSADLKKPQLTILVEILKSVCCLTILAEYNKHKKYNLVELSFANKKESNIEQKISDDKLTAVDEIKAEIKNSGSSDDQLKNHEAEEDSINNS